MVASFLAAILFPLLAPLVIHALSPVQEGLFRVRTRGGKEVSRKPAATFMVELPMAMFANSIWGISYSLGGLQGDVSNVWMLIFFSLAVLQIVLRIRLSRNQPLQYLLTIGLATLSLAATVIRIVAPTTVPG